MRRTRGSVYMMPDASYFGFNNTSSYRICPSSHYISLSIHESQAHTRAVINSADCIVTSLCSYNVAVLVTQGGPTTPTALQGFSGVTQIAYHVDVYA